MMNYKSTVSILSRAGFGLTNRCRYGGEVFHDFNSRKKDASVSLVIDEGTGSVSRVEVTTRKWDDKRRVYLPVKENITELEKMLERFAPRKEIVL